jgi:hypothetical protein
MSVDLRTITLQNLEHVVHVLNESSRGTSVEHKLDAVQFLALAHYWNFSYKHSLLSYVDTEPAAIILNCTDEQNRDAYTFYWGALPAFRDRRVALRLFEASCKSLRDDGYLQLYGDAVPDRPVRRYRFIQARDTRALFEMKARVVWLPQPDTPYEIRRLDPAALSTIALPADETLHWSQRHSFIRNAATLLEIFGAFDPEGLKAYTVVARQAADTTIIDLRSPTSCLDAGRELLRSLMAQKYPLPFRATNVFEDSYSHRLLTTAAFRIRKRLTSLCRDLNTTH